MLHDSDTESRLQALASKKGADLISGITEEILRCHKETARLRRELSALTDYQATKDQWLLWETHRPTEVRFPHKIMIQADEFLDARDGFYAVEYTEKGVPFCWTGPSPRFSFEVFVDRSTQSDLVLEAFQCLNLEIQKNMSLIVDGEPTSLELRNGPPGLQFHAVLPKRDSAGGTHLVFLMPRQLSPGTGDPRPLGLSFVKLTVRPKEVVLQKSGSAEISEVADAPVLPPMPRIAPATNSATRTVPVANPVAQSIQSLEEKMAGVEITPRLEKFG
jgi:hypothetical protein